MLLIEILTFFRKVLNTLWLIHLSFDTVQQVYFEKHNNYLFPIFSRLEVQTRVDLFNLMDIWKYGIICLFQCIIIGFRILRKKQANNLNWNAMSDFHIFPCIPGLLIFYFFCHKILLSNQAPFDQYHHR